VTKKEKKADIWMPWYVGEYLADTTNLNTEQHGAYCLMIMAAWKRGGKLPFDDGQLASITKLPTAKWRANRAILLEFFQEEDGFLVQKRVAIEHKKAKENSAKKAINGAKGAAKRWQEGGKPVANASESGVANASQTDAPSPSPLPSVNQGSAGLTLNEDPPEEWWKGAPLPEEEDPEPSTDPSVVMAVALRKMQVSVTYMHPTLLDWVKQGVTVKDLTEAVALVRMRPGKESGPINPNYLATVLVDMKNPVKFKGPAVVPIPTAKPILSVEEQVPGLAVAKGKKPEGVGALVDLTRKIVP
jgi:uncharacterized protein YdaU (DUF1376 family)